MDGGQLVEVQHIVDDVLPSLETNADVQLIDHLSGVVLEKLQRAIFDGFHLSLVVS